MNNTLDNQPVIIVEEYINEFEEKLIKTLDKAAINISELVETSNNLLITKDDKTLYEGGKSHAKTIKKVISEIENKRKELKAPITEIGKNIDNHAKEKLQKPLKDALETVLLKMKIYEDEQERIKQEKIKEEQIKKEKELALERELKALNDNYLPKINAANSTDELNLIVNELCNINYDKFGERENEALFIRQQLEFSCDNKIEMIKQREELERMKIAAEQEAEKQRQEILRKQREQEEIENRNKNRQIELIQSGFSFDGNCYYVADFKRLDLNTIFSLSDADFNEVIVSGKRHIDIKREQEQEQEKAELERIRLEDEKINAERKKEEQLQYEADLLRKKEEAEKLEKESIVDVADAIEPKPKEEEINKTFGYFGTPVSNSQSIVNSNSKELLHKKYTDSEISAIETNHVIIGYHYISDNIVGVIAVEDCDEFNNSIFPDKINIVCFKNNTKTIKEYTK